MAEVFFEPCALCLVGFAPVSTLAFGAAIVTELARSAFFEGLRRLEAETAVLGYVI
jgi:hypothetical protein